MGTGQAAYGHLKRQDSGHCSGYHVLTPNHNIMPEVDFTMRVVFPN